MAEETKTTGTEVQQDPGAAGADPKAEGSLADKIRELLGFGPKKEEKQTDPETKPLKEEKQAEQKADPEGKNQEETDPAGKPPEKTYTQADLDAAVKAAREELEAQQAEEKRQAKLTPEQRAAEEQEAMKKQNAELSAKIKRMELEQKAAVKLAEKKLPAGLSGFLDYTDEEKMAASLDKIGALYQENLEAGIKERLKGKTPKGLGSAANLTDGMINAEIAKRIRGGV